jgi:hypothetical protein
MIKNQRITIRLAAREADQLAAEAEAAGVNVSDFVRQTFARCLDVDRIAAALARDLAAELRSDFQVQAADVDAKLKLISDQVAALSMIIKENRK